MSLFHEAVKEYGLPDRVRSDKGGENIKVLDILWLSWCQIGAQLSTIIEL